jgi:hypothetical protein
MINKKPKKSIFIHGPIGTLTRNEEMYCRKIKNILQNKSIYENIGYVPGLVSKDGKERSLILSRNIIKKIQFDHGKICLENMVINAHCWDYIVSYPYSNLDKIMLIKQIQNCHNYLVLAANRNNGFYLVTHFEVEAMDDKNLKRRLGRGNVLSRGPSICL